MDTLQTIENRRSIRKYQDRPVDEETLLKVLRYAQMAPSASNAQPWHITVLDDMRVAREIDDDARTMLGKTGSIFFNAPTVLVISMQMDKTWREVDCGILSATLCLAAEAAGLGSCMIGYARRVFDVEERAAYYARKLNLPEGFRPLMGITLGYADEAPASRPRDNKVNRV